MGEIMRFAVSAIALIASAGLASAADLGGPSYGGSLKDDYVAPVAHSWSGLYIGANVGHAWGDIKFRDVIHNDEPQDGTGKLEPDGWFGGGQIGFNLQRGNIVLGLEADLQGADISDGVSGIVLDEFADEATGRVAVHVNYFGSVRGRLGVAMDRVMPYVTGGFAWADVELDTAITADDYSESRSDTAIHTGWVLGGGLEVALDQNWSLRGEYLYYDLGKKTYSVTYPDPESETLSSKADLTFHTFRIGVNYKFGG